MNKIWLLGGTTEGRELAFQLSRLNVPLLVSVATEYGKELVSDLPGAEILIGRLDRGAMLQLVRREDIKGVIDATHPYAREVTDNVKQICREEGIPYIRFTRGRSDLEPEIEGGMICVESCEEGADFLNERTGNILLTTGSKELHCFTRIRDYKERIYARVLPSPEVVSQCVRLGIKGTHLIAMQGPFSREMNKEMLKLAGASYLVTKDGGEAGGFNEKVQAASEMGIKIILIKPPHDEGETMDDVLNFVLQIAKPEKEI